MLDQICPPLGENGGPAIKAAQEALSLGYGQLRDGAAPPIDYSDRATQAAYVFSYLAPNASLVYAGLSRAAAEVQAAMALRPVRIVAVGGGPGTELVALFKFIELYQLANVEIELTILDRNPAWAVIWPIAAATAPAGATARITFRPFSMHENGFEAPPVEIATADIVIFSYCLSEAWRYNAEGVVSARLADLIAAAKPGALFIYVDNGGTFDVDLDRDFINATGVHHLFRFAKQQFIGSEEQFESLRAYHDWIKGRMPRWTGRATVAGVMKG
jgi:ribosomal protein RSM22 (predicted rRNA methylase)